MLSELLTDLRGFDYYTQVDHYDDRKRPHTAVYGDVNGRNRQNYDRIRAVNHPFGMDRITVVRRRVVYGEKRTSFTLKYGRNTAVFERIRQYTLPFTTVF